MSKPAKDKQPIWPIIAMVAAVLLLTGIIYAPSLSNGFTNWDDQDYVVENLNIRTWSGTAFGDHFSEYVAGNYHPFTMLSLSLDYTLHKLSPKGYHTTQLILHLLNTLLVFVLVQLLFKRKIAALIVALLFGIHPMHVESVAWISERKDVLYTFFYLLSLILYVRMNQAEQKKLLWYVGCLLLFVASLLSKGMAVTLPVVLLLIDHVQGKPLLHKFQLNKIPFIALSIVFGIIALQAQSEQEALQTTDPYSFLDRILFAGYGLLSYLWKFLLPLKLSAFYAYPYKPEESRPFWMYLPILLVSGLAYVLIWKAKHHPKVLFGSLFFLANVLLVLQIIGVGRAVIADRYTYVSYIGLFVLVGLAFDHVWQQKAGRWTSWRLPFAAVLVIWTGFCAVMAFQRTKVWKDSPTLWSDVIKQFPTVFIAYNNRAEYYIEKEQNDKALQDLNKAIELNPNDPMAYTNRSYLLMQKGQLEASLEDLNRALSIDPENADAYTNRGNLNKELGQHERAIADFNKALSYQPNDASIYNNRAISYTMLEQHNAALADFNKALELNPYYTKAWFNRATFHLNSKNFDQAVHDFSQAIELDPSHAPAWYNRSLALSQLGQYQAAYQDALQAQQLGMQLSPSYMENLRERQ